MRKIFFRSMCVIGTMLVLGASFSLDGGTISFENAMVAEILGILLLYISIFVGGEDVTEMR